MENQKSITAINKDQKIRLVDGEFTPSEACDIINALLEQKINFHKLQRLAMWEGNINANASFPNSRIDELETERKSFKEYMRIAREEGAMLKIKGNLEITLIR
ncbi:MAG: hypothetical protein ABF293_05065 [Flavobacteriaceae bacterium]